jgi:hypothetical protein
VGRGEHQINVRQLKRAFAVLLFVLAAYMAGKGLAALMERLYRRVLNENRALRLSCLGFMLLNL